MLRRVRIISQIVFFVLFISTVFFILRPPAVYGSWGTWFLRLNPLVGLLTAIAARSIQTPLALLCGTVALATILFGRFFCSMICPLGATIDFFDRYLFKKMRFRKACPPLVVQKLKYVLLVAFLVLALFGSLLPFFMDPILIMTRVCALVLNPLVMLIAQDGRAALMPVLSRLELTGIAYATIKVPVYYGIAGVLGLAGLIIIAGLFDRRFWCQYICPTGAFLGLLGRFAIFRRTVDTARCDSCKACVVACSTHAIAEDGKSTNSAECIVCGACTARKKSCNSFGFAAFSVKEMRPADVQRRHVMAGILGGVFLVPSLRANASALRDIEGRTVRPPGAIPEEKFLARCISCGACMKVCPTNAIQPCLLSEGLQRVYTPRIVPRIGGCEEKCYACGYACPTGALRKLTYEQKRFVKIGTAVIDRHRCLAWEQNKECVVCDEVCPYNAITVRIVETTTGPFKVPVIDEDLCLGCGMCEQHCPIVDRPAILVFRFGEKRLEHGPYVRQDEKEAILQKRMLSDQGIGSSLSEGWRERGVPVAETPANTTAAVPEQSGGGEALPPGFIF